MTPEWMTPGALKTRAINNALTIQAIQRYLYNKRKLRAYHARRNKQ